MFWLFMTVLWVVMLVAPLALLVALLPPGRDCPRCGSETLPIVMRALRPLQRLMSHRWCTACGWEGMMRTAPRAQPVPAMEAVHDSHDEVDDDAVWRGGKDTSGI